MQYEISPINTARINDCTNHKKTISFKKPYE